MTESMLELGATGQHKLRFMKKEIIEKAVDFGFSCLVGDKAIRIFPNNLVEIADLEFIRTEDAEDLDLDSGTQAVAYTERLSWQTHYPESLTRAEVMASIDYAFMSAALPSLFFLTNLYLTQFETIEEERTASIKAFEVLYPGIAPTKTELNGTLRLYGQDLFHMTKMNNASDA